MNNYGYIYKTTNLINNKLYIGQHKGEFDKNYLGSGKVIKQAIKKYGEDTFAVVLLGLSENKKSADILEKYYIAYYRKLLGCESIYNIAEGGQGGSKPVSEETRNKLRQYLKSLGDKHPSKRIEVRRKISDGEKNKTVSESTRKKISNATSGRNNPVFGRKWMFNKKENQVGLIKPTNFDMYLNRNWVFSANRTGINNPNFKHGERCKNGRN